MRARFSSSIAVICIIQGLIWQFSDSMVSLHKDRRSARRLGTQLKKVNVLSCREQHEKKSTRIV